MAFADPMPLSQRSAGMAGALIIPGALGALLIAGLAVKEIVLPAPIEPVETFNIPPPTPPEPPKNPPEPTLTSAPIAPPLPPVDFPLTDVNLDTTPVIQENFSEIGQLPFFPFNAGPPAMPSVKPAIATPRNDPGRWVTTNDYRSIWINREFAGTAQFELSVSASGKVDSCRITRSTGFAALDDATCKLIVKRARFKPATDAAGDAVSGTYASSIRWVLPD